MCMPKKIEACFCKGGKEVDNKHDRMKVQVVKRDVQVGKVCLCFAVNHSCVLCCCMS